ncbi:MAG: type II toxin-antitoxin system VapC family toxin [Solirubrobacteraceae bacterium]
MIVVDASVLAPAVADDGDDGDRARARLHGERLVAPALVDLEVTSVLRRAALGGRLDPRRAAQALADLRALPLARAAHPPLLDRIWELRENVTAYDGAYVALAEAMRAPLITADGRLAAAPGLRCAIEVLA